VALSVLSRRIRETVRRIMDHAGSTVKIPLKPCSTSSRCSAPHPAGVARIDQVSYIQNIAMSGEPGRLPRLVLGVSPL